MSFRQITDPASEPLRPIAVMRLEPDDFASRFGIDFEEGSTDLDFTRSALIEFESGLVAGLVRYARSSRPGTELHAPERSADPQSALHEFLTEFDLDERDVTWVLPQAAIARAGS
jgi:hypothetical protein